MKRKLIAGAAMAAIAVLTMTGCTFGDTPEGGSGGGGDSAATDVTFAADSTLELFDAVEKVEGTLKGKRIAFVPILFEGYTITNNWYNSIARVLDASGAKVDVYDPNFDTDVMVKSIDDIIAKKSADVLVMHNPDVGVLTKQIAAAKDAGIYTVVLNLHSNQMGDAFIGVNMYNAAKDIAQRAIDDCEAKGGPKGLAIIQGPGNDGLSLQWEKGIGEVAEKAGYDIVSTSPTQWQQSEAQEAASSTIQQYKGKFCAFLVAFDLNSIPVGDEVAGAVARKDLKQDEVGVYTMGGDALWCDALRSGKVTASAAYDVDGLGSSAATTVQQLLERGEPAGSHPTASFIAHTIVDKNNVDEVSMACYTGK